MPVSVGTFEMLPAADSRPNQGGESGKDGKGGGKDQKLEPADVEPVLREIKERASRVRAH